MKSITDFSSICHFIGITCMFIFVFSIANASITKQSYTLVKEIQTIGGGIGESKNYKLQSSIGPHTAIGRGKNYYYQLHGGIFPKNRNKAIIIAGSGNYYGNELWKSSKLVSHLAYRTLLWQGYTKENIYFMSDEVNIDIDGNFLFDDIDDDISLRSFLYAMTDWAKDATSLLVYITTHGEKEKFKLNSSDDIEAEDLNDYFNNLQKNMSGRIIFIYDACYSEGFLDFIKPLTNKERIVIGSTKKKEKAVYYQDGYHSFSAHFWNYLSNGGKLYYAFEFAKIMMEMNQKAFIDSNGNGFGNDYNDIGAAQDIIVGSGCVFADDIPMMPSSSQNELLILNGEFSTSISVHGVNDTGGISKVIAIVTPPNIDIYSSGGVITEMPSFELFQTGPKGSYTGSYSDFSVPGTYNISVFAIDNKGNYSLPNNFTILQKKGDVFYSCDMNSDYSVNLEDMIITLQLLTGIQTQNTIPEHVLVKNHHNNTIGLQKLMSIMTQIKEKQIFK